MPRAADDFEAIRARRAELAAEEQEIAPRCPSNSARLLADCLRSAAPCPEGCPQRGDWIGPQP